MSKKSSIKQPVFFTGEEFADCRRALRAIGNRVQNVEKIFVAAGERSAEEFKQAMAIIRKGGAQ
jgi:spermidine synthase